MHRSLFNPNALDIQHSIPTGYLTPQPINRFQNKNHLVASKYEGSHTGTHTPNHNYINHTNSANVLLGVNNKINSSNIGTGSWRQNLDRKKNEYLLTPKYDGSSAYNSKKGSGASTPYRSSRDPTRDSYDDLVNQKVDLVLKNQPRGSKSWMTEEILEKINERDRLFQLMKENEDNKEIEAEYKKVRNIVVTGLSQKCKNGTTYY